MRDYLGSTRAVFDITLDYAEDLSEVILEQNDYCLFGSRIDNADLPTLAQNRFRFNGKEKLVAGANDTGLTDYGARMFSAPLARWTTPDPLADKYYSISPYAFCNNNPVNLVDPDGRLVGTALDIISVASGVKNLIQNIKAGNVKDAILDGVGIVVDVAAAAVPVVPGRVGMLRAGAKVVNGADNVADAAKAVNTTSKACDAAEGGKIYVTYTKTNEATGEVYSGRASGRGNPEDIVKKRDQNHHKNKEGFGPAVPDKYSYNSDAIRGREQHLIDLNGGAKSQGGTSGNAINGISPKNPNKKRYEDAARKEFNH